VDVVEKGELISRLKEKIKKDLLEGIPFKRKKVEKRR
jgi:hypothetical protein